MTSQPSNRFVFVAWPWPWHLPCNGNQASIAKFVTTKNLLINMSIFAKWSFKEFIYNVQGVPKKGIDKKLSVGAAHDFNSQFLKLFGL